MEISLIYTEKDIWAFGIRSISAVLREAGHHTKMIIINGNDGDACKPRLLEWVDEIVRGSDIVGISCFSRGSDKARQICKYLRNRSKDRVIAWGGVHATLNPEECAMYADVVCVGEGEGFLLDLANCIQNRKEWTILKNAEYSKDGQLNINDVRPLIKDLDGIPSFDFSFDDEYHQSENGFTKIDRITDRAIPIMYNGTRGCAFSCNYCSNSQIKSIYKGKGKFVRKQSPGKYIQSLKKIQNTFPVAKYLNLLDEDFFAYGQDEIEEFARLYKKHIALPFECMGSPRNAVKEKIEPLAAAGLWRVNIGVESGSERTKKNIYNRHITNKEVIKASEVINEFKDIILNCFIIIGNPYEKKADLLETIGLLKRMRAPFFITIYNLIFFPGTRLFTMACKDGIITGRKDSGYNIDFLSGYKYSNHIWKYKNLYLNGIIFLMMGKVTNTRMGLIPRVVINFLINPSIISFNEQNKNIVRFLILFKQKLWNIRRIFIRIVKISLRNPTAIHK